MDYGDMGNSPAFPLVVGSRDYFGPNVPEMTDLL
jgi:hypothetical protein